jgi:hypothetical protein
MISFSRRYRLPDMHKFPRRTLIFAIAALFLVCGNGARAVESAVYVPGTEDIPLMPGLAPAPDGMLVFDQPQGRIVEVTTSGPVRRRDVLSFYRESLPELGWAAHGKHDFERAGERLSLDIAGHDGHLTVAFSLIPG